MRRPSPLVHSHEYENGLVLVAQPMPWLESAAFSFHVPAGCRYDPADRIGLANFVCEMVQRGAGPYDSRGFIEALESLGVDYSSSVSVYGTHFGGASRAAELLPALQLYADVLRRPHLPESQLEEGRQVCFQEIHALEDDLAQRVLVQLRERHYGDPDGRDVHGTIESVSSLTSADIRQFFEQNYRPNGTILAVAGQFDWAELRERVAQWLGDWAPREVDEPAEIPAQHGVCHLPFESQQTHIGLAYPTVPVDSPDFYCSLGSVNVLSGGMSSRLFYEVREKRGLCYSVFATNHYRRDRACVICYAGTTVERAQQTLDVLVDQLRRLEEGITSDELRRLRVQVRTDLMLQQESCRARASAIAGDWFHLGRVRSLEEINQHVGQLTVDRMNRFLADHPPREFDLVTLGPQPLEFSRDGVSPTPVG